MATKCTYSEYLEHIGNDIALRAAGIEAKSVSDGFVDLGHGPVALEDLRRRIVSWVFDQLDDGTCCCSEPTGLGRHRNHMRHPWLRMLHYGHCVELVLKPLQALLGADFTRVAWGRARRSIVDATIEGLTRDLSSAEWEGRHRERALQLEREIMAMEALTELDLYAIQYSQSIRIRSNKLRELGNHPGVNRHIPERTWKSLGMLSHFRWITVHIAHIPSIPSEFPTLSLCQVCPTVLPTWGLPVERCAEHSGKHKTFTDIWGLAQLFARDGRVPTKTRLRETGEFNHTKVSEWWETWGERAQLLLQTVIDLEAEQALKPELDEKVRARYVARYTRIKPRAPLVPSPPNMSAALRILSSP
jgi:hypothetical protein